MRQVPKEDPETTQKGEGFSKVSGEPKQKEDDGPLKSVEKVDSGDPNKNRGDDETNVDNLEKQDEGDEKAPLNSEEVYKLQPMFVCCCGASFQFLGQITSHKKKSCEWIYVCPHCDRVYKDFDKMTEHKQEHKKPPVQLSEPVPAPTELGVQKDETKEESQSKEKDEDVKVESSGDVKADVVMEDKQDDKGDKPKDDKSKDDKPKDDKLKDDKPKVSDEAPKKIELAHAQVKSKLLIRPVEKKIPPHIRGRIPNQNMGNFLGNQMRPNMMQNQGGMNPQQYFMGGFNQGMNNGMGMQPMMNMGMGNFGQMNPGMNMGNFGGFNNMGNQFCGPNMGMNMGMNMGGMNNMGMMNNMGGMNMGMNMGMGGMNNGPNMIGMNNGPNMMGMNSGPNMGAMNPNMGGMNSGAMGGMNSGTNMGGMNSGPNMGGMKSGPNMGGMNSGSSMGGMTSGNQGFNPAPGGKVTPGSRDLNVSRSLSILDKGRDLKIDPPMRGRSISPPRRRGDDSRGSHGLSPPRRGLDRDGFRERDFRDRFDYRDDDAVDRLSASDRKWKDDSRDRYSPSDLDRSDRLWPTRSLTREEFLSSSTSSFFSKPASAFPKNDVFDRAFAQRDDGPPGLGKLGFSGLQKRDNTDPHVISRPSKIMRSSEYH
ncbi:hypothetical protein GE061_003599 [Apolygus lucorum]|uniref:Uncharacterized protein n=1 Tax=Apolygus lucorum TaxID=248454 RepID=A0A6A4JT44_APOLU|nr:hypothetical protein GE061_003599 [Apolygus lucorum]